MTPTEIEASAILKIGLKNSNCSPPQNGTHFGSVVSKMGK
jgi:hypothetical protein